MPSAASHLLPLFLSTLMPSVICASSTLRYEAENATLVGNTRIAHENADGSGRAWVTGFVKNSDALDFNLKITTAGDYTLQLIYAAESPKQIPVSIDGNLLGNRRFAATKGFTTQTFGRVPLLAGSNKLRIGTDWGYADIDAIEITPADEPIPFQISDQLVSPNASTEAQQLYTRLVNSFGKSTFSGQHESNPEQPTRLQSIAALTDGKVPAILGLDLLRYSPAYAHPKGDGVIEAAQDWVLNHQGIVTLSWHWMSPLNWKDPVWSSFYTKNTHFDASRITDTTSPEYKAILRDIDFIASQLKILRDAKVPILWRPLHEAEGGWFWWGAHGPETSKALYCLMFDRFTQEHHLNNLIWVWTAMDNEQSLDWYPGDQYVDIVAADLYAPAGAHGDYFTTFDRLRNLHGGRKLIAMGECGVIPDINPQAPWLWFLTWDNYISRADYNTPEHVADVFHAERVINNTAN